MGIADDATIKLDFCWSACASMPTSITKSKALELIQNSDFDELFEGIDGSFYESFLEELPGILPEFKGKVVGYRGTVMTSIQDNV